MKTKAGWLVVILISAVQLALMLFAVLMLFSWFLGQTEESVGRQACGNNSVIVNQIRTASNVAGIRNIRENDDDRNKMADLISSIEIPNEGFIAIIDAKTGALICQSSNTDSFVDIGQLEIESDSDTKKESSRLIDSVTNKTNERNTAGKMLIDGKSYHTNAEFQPQLNSIFVVGQRGSKTVAAVAGKMAYAKRIAFAGTMLIGLIGLCLIFTILNRMTQQVEEISLDLEQQVSERERQLVKTQNAVIFGLAKLAESRDNDTGEHLDRIRSYVTILANDLATHIPDMGEDLVHNLALASSLHDIGKVGIPDSILLKPGRLTQEEREVMELHTLIGGECLEAIQSRLGDNVFMHIAKQIAYYHHERWDGKGYPHGLAEDEIPLVARIVAVADVYDALTSKRPYKEPMTHFDSKAIIVSGSGSQFDPEVVASFLRHEDKFEMISRSQLSLSDDDVRSDFHVLCERAQHSAGKSVPASA
ncbi:MAG: HD-GYP domain-containing protein [Mariniblastus sp.]